MILPFQIVENLGWYTILVVTITAYFYLGFLAIGSEIANPFDFGKNDLDLDLYCIAIRKEIHEVVSHPADCDPWNWSEHLSLSFDAFLTLLSVEDSANRPLASVGDNRSVSEILRDADRAEIGGHANVLRSVNSSIAAHFRTASAMAAQEGTREWRHQQKKGLRKKIQVDYFQDQNLKKV